MRDVVDVRRRRKRIGNAAVPSRYAAAAADDAGAGTLTADKEREDGRQKQAWIDVGGQRGSSLVRRAEL